MHPTYESLYGVAEAMGCDVHYWHLRENEQERCWGLDIAELKQMLPGAKLVILNFPNNPTGYVPSAQQFQTIMQMISDEGAFLLCDEMYRLLDIDDVDADAEESGSMIPPACALGQNAFSLSGLSKSYGLPGLRIGWVASRNKDVLTKMLSLKDYTTICASTTSQMLAVIALDNTERIVKAHVERVRRNLQALEAFISRNSSLLSLSVPHGGSVCFPSINLPKKMTAQRFCDELVEKTSILLVPSDVFGMRGHVRFGLGRESFQHALKLFEDSLKLL